MVHGGRRKSIAFFIALGVGLILVILLLYIGWVLLGWRNGILLFFGILLVLTVIAGVVLNTTFLVREIRRNAQHDAFINAVTHELKTPVASIRLYLETLQTRPVEDAKRQELNDLVEKFATLNSSSGSNEGGESLVRNKTTAAAHAPRVASTRNGKDQHHNFQPHSHQDESRSYGTNNRGSGSSGKYNGGGDRHEGWGRKEEKADDNDAYAAFSSNRRRQSHEEQQA